MWHECNIVRYNQHDCDTGVTRVPHEQRESGTSATRTTRVRHEWKTFILITTQVKTCFHTPVFTTWQVKDYKERNSFILRTTFWKCLVPMPKCVWKVHHKNFLMAKDIWKSYTLDCSCTLMPLHVPS